MTNCRLKKDETFSKNWVNILNNLKIQQKNYFSPQNGNLYAYAANNPVRYMDPDGNSPSAIVLTWIGTDASVPEPTDLIPWKWVGYTVAFLGVLAVEHLSIKAISQSISNSKNKENSIIYVYHHTGESNKGFANKLRESPSSIIDFSLTDKDSRFGQCFYVASDPYTASVEASDPGIVVKMKMSPNANILDLTNPDIARQYGYTDGMTRDEARYMMINWNLTGIDAIKYPSEKNPGGYNYAVLNTFILSPAE